MPADIQQALEAFKAGNKNKALSICRKLNKALSARTFDSMQIEAVCWVDKRRNEKAIECFVKALAFPTTDSKKSHVLKNLAQLYSKAGQIREAVKYLEQAIPLLPKQQSLNLRMELAKLYGKLNLHTKVVETLLPLRGYTEYYVQVTASLVETGLHLSDMDMAMKYLRELQGHIDLLSPQFVLNLLARVAIVKPDEVRPLARRISAKGGDYKFVSMIEAQSCLDENDSQGVLDIIDVTFLDTAPSWIKLDWAHNVRAKALDKLKRYDEAFRHFTLMNEFAKKQIDPSFWSLDKRERYAQMDSFKPQVVEESLPYKMAFMVGFPRSGTTLLENILNSQEQLFTLDEKPVLQHVFEKIEEDGYQYPEDLNMLSDSYLTELRALYFEKLTEFIPENFAGQLVVDKMPPAMLHIPLILALFPDAKIILSVRHPLDNVLSCFMQNFKLNPQMVYFTDWEKCFERYRDLFNLYEHFQSKLTWQECQIRYEDLVTDFESEVQRVFSFLEIEADNSYKQFHKSAQKRIITTPSRDQVKKGLYQTSKYRWKNYLKFVQPHSSMLAKFIKQFGYDSVS